MVLLYFQGLFMDLDKTHYFLTLKELYNNKNHYKFMEKVLTLFLQSISKILLKSYLTLHLENFKKVKIGILLAIIRNYHKKNLSIVYLQIWVMEP